MTTKGTSPTPRDRLRLAATIRLPDARLPRDEVDVLLDEFEAAARQQGLRDAAEIVDRVNLYDPEYRVKTMAGPEREQYTMADAALSQRDRSVAAILAALSSDGEQEGGTG